MYTGPAYAKRSLVILQVHEATYIRIFAESGLGAYAAHVQILKCEQSLRRSMAGISGFPLGVKLY